MRILTMANKKQKFIELKDIDNLVPAEFVTIEIKPIGYVRRTRADAWKKRPEVLNYYAFLDELRWKLGNFKLENCFEIIFGLPFPDSYSEKKKEQLLGMPHQIKPDLDNLIKAASDGLRGVGENNDSRIYKFRSEKVWSKKGFIKIRNI